MADFEGLGIARDGVTLALFCTDPRGMSDDFTGGWRACGLQPSTNLPPGARAPCTGAHSWRLDDWRLPRKIGGSLANRGKYEFKQRAAVLGQLPM